MAFALSLLYLVLTFLSPEQLFPELVPYRPMVWLGLLALLVSVPTLISNHLSIRALQTRLLLALLFAMMLSEIAGFWFGGVLVAVQGFGPSIVAFLLIVVNVNTMKRFRIFALLLVGIGLVLTIQAVVAYHWGINARRFVIVENYYSKEGEILASLRRIRAVGFLQDPNDFAQFLLTVMPLLWVSASHRRRWMLAFVPGALIIYGIFLTHSRGAFVGMAVVLLVALLPRMGKTGSTMAALLLALVLFGSSLLGGRNVSADMGESDDSAHKRLQAWSEGLALFKRSPIFGVGYTRFTEHNELTAHNSFVLCLAELGLVGTTIWIALFVTTILALNKIAAEPTTRPPPLSTAGAYNGPALWRFGQSGHASTAAAPALAAKNTTAPVSSSDPARWAHAVRVSISAFVATAWFLSRTYVTTLYVLLGMAVALILIATPSERRQREQRRNWLPVTAAVEVLALILVYVMVRLRH